MKFKYYKRIILHTYTNIIYEMCIYRTYGQTVWVYRNNNWELCYPFKNGDSYANYIRSSKENYNEITEAEAFIELL